MANVLSSFLIGVGFDYDQKGQKEIGSGIDGLKSKALQLGSVVAGAFGVKALTSDFAKSRDEIGKFSDTFGVLPEDVFALGKALEHEGGSVDSFMSQLANLEKMRAGILAGDASFISAAGRAGITDTSIITNAENATDAYLALGDVFAGLSQQERLNAADALGFDEASIRLLSNGSDAVSTLVDRQKNIRTVTREMTEQAALFNDEMQDMLGYIGGFADNISMKALPEINKMIGGMNEWLGVNKEFIDQNMDEVLDAVGDHLGGVAAAGALLASGGLLTGLAGMAKYVPIIGKGIGVAASATAKLTGLGAGALIGNEILKLDGKSVLNKFGIDAPDWFTKPVRELEWSDFGIGDDDPTEDQDYSPGSHYSPSDLPSTGDSTPDLPLFGSNNVQSNNKTEVTVNMMLDGQVLDTRIVSVVDGQAELAYQDIKSNVAN